MTKDLEQAQDAYLALLALPHGGVREQLQGAMCILCDHIARAEGVEAEAIQSTYEAIAALRKEEKVFWGDIVQDGSVEIGDLKLEVGRINKLPRF